MTAVVGVPAAVTSRVDGAAFRAGPYLVFLILTTATIPWRSKTYYEGGADPVVLAKAALTLLGLVLAYVVCRGQQRRFLRPGPVLVLSAYLACTVVGGWAAGSLVPSAVVAVRVGLLAVAVCILASGFDAQALIGSLVAALATYAFLGALTGLASSSGDRLRGGFPPLNPNELASMCAVIVLWCLWRLLAGQDAWIHLAAMGVALAILAATGSRTPLAALPLGAAVLILHVTAVRLRTVVIAVVALPALVWLVGGTGFFSSLVLRGGDSQGLTTLSNRTIAWQAALTPKDSWWLEWFGGGLVMKRIPVPGQWWNEQILDSSWISALVQGGLIGLGLCVGWLLYSMVSTVDSPVGLRALQLALLVYLGSRGLLESGLFDASPAFLVFVTVAATVPLRARGDQSSARGRTGHPAVPGTHALG